MAKNIKEEFLSAYREFEDTLRSEEPPLTVYEYSMQLDENDNDSKRLQLCRLIRNYLSHQPDEFIAPSAEMITFIKGKTEEINRKHKTAKDIMTRMTPLTVDTKVSDAASKLGSKKPFLVVCDKDKQVIGLFTRETIRKAVVEKTHAKTIKTAGGLEKPICFAKPDDLAENVFSLTIITSDGSAKGTYKGVVI